MEREKEIEEMAKELAQCCEGNRLVICKDDIDCSRCRAEWLSKLNYRKIPEGAVVLTREECDNKVILDEDHFLRVLDNEREKARKETAREILKGFSDILELIKDNGDSKVLLNHIEMWENEYGVEVEK